METLPKEIILEIASNMELRDLKKFCSQNKAIETFCEMNTKTILTNIFKRKGRAGQSFYYTNLQNKKMKNF